ncbi:GAS8-like protein, putative [Plasmodium ovale curtisi]|uniref:GAS8-like protein, putative n=1 Tax=Plasmodium ovale curtisi TaxID=864141 RepID=A0A1A8X354_PLAOA|nr:GAS8-like protein, putative [Plasmodium ovale curtisi]SBS98596.1 GAS8-like protein, putative [Plasmodium ovale curtisi]
MHNSVVEFVLGIFLTMHVPSFFKEEKNEEFECFKKEYNEIKNKIDFISEGCEKYDEKVKEEPKIIKHKSVFYNFQNVEELKKLLKEKEEIKILIDEKHEQTMNKLMSYIEEQRINLDYVKNKNFDEINELNSSFDLKMKKMEELFTKHLKIYEDDQKEDMEEMIENYEIMERNEIIYLKNLYNDHINKVNEIYIDVLQNYKKYYIDQIRENISKIKSLKKNINDLELNDKEIKNDLNNYNSQNSSMQENIKNLEMKRENLNEDLKFYSKDFVIFKNLELIYNESEVYIKNLQQFAQSSKEKISQVENALKKLSQDEDINFDGYFENIKNKNIILRKKIEGLNFDLDAVEKELASYIKKNNIKEEDVQRVRKGINFCLHTYNKEYDNLLYAQRNVKKKIKNSVNIYEKKLKDINVGKQRTSGQTHEEEEAKMKCNGSCILWLNGRCDP